MTGSLFLIPVPLGYEAAVDHDPRIARLQSFIVENPKVARAHLKRLGVAAPLSKLSLQVLDEHSQPEAIPELLAPLLSGDDVGLMSDAGCPAIADPGATLVAAAHARDIRVVPLVGACSIVLALMGSGLNGQRFAFHGYLPSERTARGDAICELERESKARAMTQIFIEAPYRNQHLLNSLLERCRDDTRLCLASDLLQASQSIRTQAIKEWKRDPPGLHKKPTVFLIAAEG